MQEIKYKIKIDKDTGRHKCATRCPNGMNRWVGSGYCCACDFYIKNDQDNNVLTCNYGDENVKI